MFIKKIHIDNFKIYYGHNEISFLKDKIKNIYLISGQNGYGKTTFLTSLVWCLYGSRIKHIDDNFKKELSNIGGYKNFASTNLNKQAVLEGVTSYSVSIEFSDFNIASLPYNSLVIKRSYCTKNKKESIVILIDGEENELAREVGPEIFINDYVLPIEIAKFFFFDSEKIVRFAEVNSIEEKQRISKAYSEILGIMKYEHLKDNLEILRIRLKKNTASKKDKQQIELIEDDIKELDGQINLHNKQFKLNEEEIEDQKRNANLYQEKLIREGSSLSIKKINELRHKKEILSKELSTLRKNLDEFLELAPFAIAGNLFTSVVNSLTHNGDSLSTNINYLKNKIVKLNKVLDNVDYISELDTKTKRVLKSQIKLVVANHILPKENKTLNNNFIYTQEETQQILEIYKYLIKDYKIKFKNLTEDYKRNRYDLLKVSRTISEAERKENDPLIKSYREKHNQTLDRIESLAKENQQLNWENEGINKILNSKKQKFSELTNKVKLDERNLQKDKIAQDLIANLETFIVQLKTLKKDSLRKSILENIRKLYHKKNFIMDVAIDIDKTIIDIVLLDKNSNIIKTDLLSKGEQQLYATAILKSLVEESKFKFPVFIDGPLQKFDHKHSKNIINEFYPNISEQVVIFPLLNKELSKSEYNLLYKNINQTFVIENISSNSSKIISIAKEEFSNKYFLN